ncbi:MAG TPA: citrate synthase [Streptosporangiaceae bacterium]
MAEWIDTAEAARRLGVRPATLYAYVSRGVLRRRHAEGGRRSLFDPAEIDELARRGRPRRPASSSELAIESAITALGPDRPYFRGRDALRLAREYGPRPDGFERVAAWLWTGEPAVEAPEAWVADPAARAAGYAAQAGLPAGVLPLDRLQVIVAAMAAADPLRFHLDRPGVLALGRGLIAGMVDSLPPAGPHGEDAGSAAPGIAERLWAKLCRAAPREGLLTAFRSALILLADHELAASTLAARVAASVRADPYAVVSSGLGVLSGPLHGGASFGVEKLLAEVDDPARAPMAIADRLRRGERVPGFGPAAYPAGDGRGVLLFDLVAAAAPEHERLAAAREIRAAARRHRLPEPNVDFALGTLAAVAGMVAGAGEAIFAVARTAGWLAHAIEEYERGTPIRPRAHYTGPPVPR